jgi:hypothetical protein
MLSILKNAPPVQLGPLQLPTSQLIQVMSLVTIMVLSGRGGARGTRGEGRERGRAGGREGGGRKGFQGFQRGRGRDKMGRQGEGKMLRTGGTKKEVRCKAARLQGCGFMDLTPSKMMVIVTIGVHLVTLHLCTSCC